MMGAVLQRFDHGVDHGAGRRQIGISHPQIDQVDALGARLIF
jgi:hypothetical protein